MENSYNSAFYYELPDADVYENQLVGRGGEPAAAAQDLGTLESSRAMKMLFSKRCGVGWGFPQGRPSLTLGAT